MHDHYSNRNKEHIYFMQVAFYFQARLFSLIVSSENRRLLILLLSHVKFWSFLIFITSTFTLGLSVRHWESIFTPSPASFISRAFCNDIQKRQCLLFKQLSMFCLIENMASFWRRTRRTSLQENCLGVPCVYSFSSERSVKQIHKLAGYFILKFTWAEYSQTSAVLNEVFSGFTMRGKHMKSCWVLFQNQNYASWTVLYVKQHKGLDK